MSDTKAAANTGQSVQAIDTKDDLMVEIDKLIQFSRCKSESTFSRTKIRDLQSKCLELKKELTPLEEDDVKFWDIYDRFLDLERSLTRPLSKWLQAIIGIVLLVIVGYFAYTFVKADNSIFGLKDQEKVKMVVFSVFGAFALLLTRTYESVLKKEKNGLFHVISFCIHFLLAIIVSFVVISLFFNEGAAAAGGNGKHFAAPELLAFIFGYSTKVVVLALNKLVEKASTMIKAI
ncbi:hypothetical protein [Terasakiella sp. SH-1]|uniref:hypothetical protein n=1 Tax=Terasakiella sp. SH-1 TaxID=2560057 RepID=UPI0010741498|nr:hypothetical protein [Terasakiella sp. SH-1]